MRKSADTFRAGQAGLPALLNALSSSPACGCRGLHRIVVTQHTLYDSVEQIEGQILLEANCHGHQEQDISDRFGIVLWQANWR